MKYTNRLLPLLFLFAFMLSGYKKEEKTIVPATIPPKSTHFIKPGKVILPFSLIPYTVQAFNGTTPRPTLAGGLQFFYPHTQNSTGFGSDWVPIDQPYIEPGTYDLCCYLSSGVSATININGTTKSVTGQGLNSVGIGDGIFLGTITVSAGFYVKAILP